MPLLGELWPHLTQCRLGRGLHPHQVASWSVQPFGHNRHGPKWSGLVGWGAGSPSKQCRLGQGLPPYQVASWSIQPFGHNRQGCCAPFWRWGAGSPSDTMWLGPMPSSIPCGILIRPTVFTIHQRHRQERTDRTGQTDNCPIAARRTVLQTVAQKNELKGLHVNLFVYSY